MNERNFIRDLLQEILVHDWLNSSKVDSTSNILFTTNTETKRNQRSTSSLADPRSGTTQVRELLRINPICLTNQEYVPLMPHLHNVTFRKSELYGRNQSVYQLPVEIH